MSDMVLIYHPELPETQLPLGAPARVALRSVDDWAARGWLLVDPGVTPPAPSTPWYPRAEADSKFLTEPAARAAFAREFVPQTKDGADRAASLRHSALRPWFAALAGVDTSPADILLVDDSTGEGTGTSSSRAFPENTWARRMVFLLRQHCLSNSVGVGGPGYIPAFYAITPAISGVGFSWAGSPTLESAFSGLGCRSAKLTGAGQVGTISLSAVTSFDVVFTKASGGGSFSVAIDGGAPVTVSAADTTTSYGNRQRFTMPDQNAHTVTIAWVSGQVWFEGLMAYRGDENNGIRLWDAAHHGFRAGNFSGDYLTGGGTAGATWARSIPATIALAINGMGLNDYGAQLGAAVYKQRMDKLNGIIRARVGATVPIVMIAKYRRADSTGLASEAVEPWANYVEALRELAAADPTVYLVDLSARMTRTDQEIAGLVSPDLVHLTNRGNRFVGHEMVRALSPLSGA